MTMPCFLRIASCLDLWVQAFKRRLRSTWQDDPCGKASKRSKSIGPENQQVEHADRTWISLILYWPIKSFGSEMSGSADRKDVSSSASSRNTCRCSAQDQQPSPYQSATNQPPASFEPEWERQPWQIKESVWISIQACWLARVLSDLKACWLNCVQSSALSWSMGKLYIASQSLHV